MLETIQTDWATVTYEMTPEKKDAIVARVLEFYKKHENFTGESICQCDGPIMDGYVVLADIADDIIEFKVECK